MLYCFGKKNSLLLEQSVFGTFLKISFKLWAQSISKCCVLPN